MARITTVVPIRARIARLYDDGHSFSAIALIIQREFRLLSAPCRQTLAKAVRIQGLSKRRKQVESVNAIAKTYKELGDKTNRTADEQKKFKTAQEQLNKIAKEHGMTKR